MLFYDARSTNSGSNNVRFMQKIWNFWNNVEKIMSTFVRDITHIYIYIYVCVCICICIYIYNIMNHYPPYPSLSSKTWESSFLEVFYEKSFWKIYENSHENSWVGVSLLIKLQVGGLQLYEKEAPSQMFSCEILQSLRTYTLWTTCWNSMY